jgi:hypothetical protein
VTDAFGHSSVDSATVSVLYNFSGFFQPVDNLPTVNVVKAGRGIPVTFSLHGYHGLNIFAAGYPKIEFVSCPTSPSDEIELTLPAVQSILLYNPFSDRYTYVWRTEKAWANTCGLLRVKLADGTTQSAAFKFT